MDYCIAQTKYLREVRMRGDHIRKSNRKNVQWQMQKVKRIPVFLNKELDKNDLHFDILEQKEATDEEKFAEIVRTATRKMVNLQRSMEQAVQTKLGYG